MDDVKILNFTRDNPHSDFPSVQILSGQDADGVRHRLVDLLGLPSDVDGLELVKTIRARATLLDGTEATSQSFNLAEVPAQWHESVLLNWGRFESLDQMKTQHVVQWFEYLWYPSADDLDILDFDFEWIISVAHSGEIYFLEF